MGRAHGTTGPSRAQAQAKQNQIKPRPQSRLQGPGPGLGPSRPAKIKKIRIKKCCFNKFGSDLGQNNAFFVEIQNLGPSGPDDDTTMRRDKSGITWPPVPSHPGTEYLVKRPPHLDNIHGTPSLTFATIFGVKRPSKNGAGEEGGPFVI